MIKLPNFALAISAIALCAGGCGTSNQPATQTVETAPQRTTVAVKPRPRLPALAPIVRPASTITNSIESKPPAESPAPRDDKETAKLLATAEQLIVLSKTNSDETNAKLNVLFSASAKNPKRYSGAAQFIAQRIADEASADSAQFARSYLLLASYRDTGVDASLLTSMAQFACEFPDSNRPIKLYKQLSNRLVADGQGSSAVAMLQHGIKNCESCRDVESLRRLNRMTVQTISLLGRTKTTTVFRPPSTAVGQQGNKPSKTKADSDYYGLIGKTANLSGKTLQGSVIGGQQLRGEWVYAHFWATW